MLFNCFETLLDLAIKEDLGELGDATSMAIFGDEIVMAELRSKDEGILAGIDLFLETFRRRGESVEAVKLMTDGDRLSPGSVAAKVKGPAVSVLSLERTALNFISYLSGIATISSIYANEAAKYGNTVILDTRKTLPGFREAAKYAVKIGGASNHRMGLYDMVMIKDNHIDAAGSIAKAVAKVKDKWKDNLKIEVECRNIREVNEAVSCGVQYIMLDNMDPETIKKALQLRKDGIKFEISGNMTLEKLKDYAGLGADFISVGSLTHSVKTFDFSFVIAKQI